MVSYAIPRMRAISDRSCALDSRDQLRDHLRRFDAGELLVEALIEVREPFVVEAQQLQHGGVEVVDVARGL